MNRDASKFLVERQQRQEFDFESLPAAARGAPQNEIASVFAIEPDYRFDRESRFDLARPRGLT